jgi:hypothetical protein
MIFCSPLDQVTLSSGRWPKLSQVSNFKVKSPNSVNSNCPIKQLSMSCLMVRSLVELKLVISSVGKVSSLNLILCLMLRNRFHSTMVSSKLCYKTVTTM